MASEKIRFKDMAHLYNFLSIVEFFDGSQVDVCRTWLEKEIVCLRIEKVRKSKPETAEYTND